MLRDCTLSPFWCLLKTNPTGTNHDVLVWSLWCRWKPPPPCNSQTYWSLFSKCLSICFQIIGVIKNPLDSPALLTYFEVTWGIGLRICSKTNLYSLWLLVDILLLLLIDAFENFECHISFKTLSVCNITEWSLKVCCCLGLRYGCWKCSNTGGWTTNWKVFQ